MGDTSKMVKSVALDYEEFFEEELNNHETFLQELYTVEGTSQLSKTRTSISGVGMPEEISENEDAPEDDGLEGYDWTVAVKTFAKSRNLSNLLKKTDQAGLHTIEQYAKDIVEKMVQHRDARAMGEPFVKAWDTSYVYGDGKQLISLSHPRKDGGTAQGNTFADGEQRPLDYDNLILLQDEFLSLVANNGHPQNIGITSDLVLMVAPKNREAAMQILQCPKVPDVVSNNINYWNKGSVGLIENPYMSYVWAYYMGWTTAAKIDDANIYDDMYFLMDKAQAKKLLQFDELNPIENNVDYNKKNRQETANTFDDFGIGLKGWNFVVGSKADSTTFSS